MLIYLSTIVTIIALALFLLEREKRIKLSRQSEDVALSEARKKSLDILDQASIKAQNIIGAALQNQMRITATQETQDIQLKETVEKKFDQALRGYVEYLTSVREEASQNLSQQTQQVFDRFEQNLSDFLVQTQEKSTHAIELEMQAARNLIDTYKRQQLNLIDEQIIEVLERTLSLVLAKKLSLEDQVDLVNEALEKAKVEKFIF